MEVILTQDIQGLGDRGSLVAVKEGYARNYLIPKALCLPATEGNRREVERMEQQAVARAQQEKQQAISFSEKLKTTSCTISAPVGESEKLHGAVTANDIAKELANQGISVDKRQVHLEQPIHQLGVYKVEVKLHPEVTQTVKVWIVKA